MMAHVKRKKSRHSRHCLLRLFLVTLLVLSLSPASVFGRTAFDEIQALSSPEIARQACALARWAVECRLSGAQPAKPPMELNRMFLQRAGVFVTITTRKGVPRGCWGTIEPQQKDIAHEIIENSIGAALADIRRKPLSPHELKHVTFCVSIVGPLRPARSMSDLAPNVLGLLVRNGSREGILLPGEAKTASWQIKECKRKAGLPPDARVQMYVFRTVALEERTRY